MHIHTYLFIYLHEYSVALVLRAEVLHTDDRWHSAAQRCQATHIPALLVRHCRADTSLPLHVYRRSLSSRLLSFALLFSSLLSSPLFT